MNKCKLLNIEMPIDLICPASKNFDNRFLCYRDCGFSPTRKEKPKTKIFIQTNFEHISLENKDKVKKLSKRHQKIIDMKRQRTIDNAWS